MSAHDIARLIGKVFLEKSAVNLLVGRDRRGAGMAGVVGKSAGASPKFVVQRGAAGIKGEGAVRVVLLAGDAGATLVLGKLLQRLKG